MKGSFLAIVLWGCCMCQHAVAQTIDHWETIIDAGDTWRYHVGTAAPDSNWKSIAFNDSAWLQGPGGFGYNDGDDATIIPTTMSVYLRREFTIADLSKIEAAVLHMDYDDAFVAYLNGVEIARANIGTSGIEPAYNEAANQWIEAQMYQGFDPPEFLFNPAAMSLLVQGNNILTIQVHNESITSSDFSAIPFLSVGINDGSMTYGTPPSWFDAPFIFSASHLPIVVINTNGQTIIDEPHINVQIGVIDNGAGNTNYITDPFNDFEGYCNIEFRGESSQMFPKKSYRVETTDSVGVDLDTIVMQFPKEEDFILHAPYSDKTLMRNVMVYSLAREMGQYATRTKYCELVINGEYRGVYVFMEKIKRDDDRVDIAKLTVNDTIGDDLTGGYIWRVDKGDEGGWDSQYGIATAPWEPLEYDYYYPGPDDILPVQEAYLQAYVDSFEDAINDPSFHHPVSGKRYTDFIDLDSWVDNFILNEFSKNVDGFRLSTYFYKDKDSNGGRIVAGPVWDYNLSFGNCEYCLGQYDYGWMYFEHCGDDNPFWWTNMWNDTIFTNALKCRWTELRQGLLSDQAVLNRIDSLQNHIGAAADRNYTKWEVLGTYVWPNPAPFPATYQEEIDHLKTWTQNRLAWLDVQMPGNLYCDPDEDTSTVGEIEHAQQLVQLYPNPTKGVVHLVAAPTAFETLLITDPSGRVVQQLNWEGTNETSLDLSEYNAGMYLVHCYRNGVVVHHERLIVQ